MKIISKKNNLVDYELHRVKKSIYVVKIDDQYQRAMLFLRYQEFYESPYKRFQGKNFDIFEFMDYYRKKREAGAFTYPKDWSGYNIPSDSFKKCIKGVFDFKVNQTPYDEVMMGILHLIYGDLKSFTPYPKEEKFYIIGTDSIKSDIMSHEIAHALFFLDRDYRKEMTGLVKDLPMRKFNGMQNILLRLGYRKEVITDEIQAFMSTGLWDEMERLKLKEDTLRFGEVFKRYVILHNLS